MNCYHHCCPMGKLWFQVVVFLLFPCYHHCCPMGKLWFQLWLWCSLSLLASLPPVCLATFILLLALPVACFLSFSGNLLSYSCGTERYGFEYVGCQCISSEFKIDMPLCSISCFRICRSCLLCMPCLLSGGTPGVVPLIHE